LNFIPLISEEKVEVVAICDHLKNLRFSRRLPNVFTEHGAVMVASVLSTSRAVEVSVFVVRAFTKMREILTFHKKLSAKISELEEKLAGHDEAIRSLFSTIRQMMLPNTEKKMQQIGFSSENKVKSLKGAQISCSHSFFCEKAPKKEVYDIPILKRLDPRRLDGLVHGDLDGLHPGLRRLFGRKFSRCAHRHGPCLGLAFSRSLSGPSDFPDFQEYLDTMVAPQSAVPGRFLRRLPYLSSGGDRVAGRVFFRLSP
jgi:hypothetical protein